MPHKLSLLLLMAMLGGCAGSDGLVRQARCHRPTLVPQGQPISQRDAARINNEGQNYRNCVKSYVAEQKLIVDKHIEIANAHAAATNRSQAAFNQYVDELSARSTDSSPGQ